MNMPNIAILLATYNGAEFLEAQLNSIQAQTHVHWTVWASDDGSSDHTLKILKSFQQRVGADRCHILNGPQQGFAANFFSLLFHPHIQADFYAFCDQDDIWKPEKLKKASDHLIAFSTSIPALYGSRAELVDASGHFLGHSACFKKTPSFKNALVQSLAGGNTLMMNHAARQLLLKAGSNFRTVSHDWWAYLVITGCGGVAVYDPTPQIQYRQHGQNVVGANSSWRAKYVRIKQLFAGQFRTWNDHHLRSLQQIHAELTPENKAVLNQFAQARQAKSLVARLKGFVQSGVYRQTGLGNLGLWFAAVCNKI